MKCHSGLEPESISASTLDSCVPLPERHWRVGDFRRNDISGDTPLNPLSRWDFLSQFNLNTIQRSLPLTVHLCNVAR
jgi:hypothetical protein